MWSVSQPPLKVLIFVGWKQTSFVKLDLVCWIVKKRRCVCLLWDYKIEKSEKGCHFVFLSKSKEKIQFSSLCCFFPLFLPLVFYYFSFFMVQFTFIFDDIAGIQWVSTSGGTLHGTLPGSGVNRLWRFKTVFQAGGSASLPRLAGQKEMSIF